MRDERGVSEILGYSLVFTLVIVSVAIVSVGGLSAFQDVESYERQSNAQKAFDVLHNNLEDIYYQSAPSRGTEIDLGDTSLAMGENVTINVTVDPNSGSATTFSVTTRPLVQDLGDGSTLVYEAGAVFQTTRGGGIVRQSPPMLLREDRTNIIVSDIRQPNARGVGGGTVLIRARLGSQVLRYDNTTRDPPAEVTLNITSPRADLWQEYLVSRGAFSENDCDYEQATDRVVCGPVSQDQVAVVESDIALLFDR